MAVTALDTIKNWFKTHLKPTQAQFWAMLDSFRHKSEKVPVADIEGLDSLFVGIPGMAEVNSKLPHGGYTGNAQILATSIETLNGLVTDLQEDDVLTAGQITTLQGQITAINTLLTSDNINLDTVQEIVDAIETVQTSLSTILVNDLTTGGTTKALTAEMGKTLKGLVDSLSAKIPKDYSKVVYVNANTPTTATIFDTNNPPVTNDNSLKSDVNNLYIGLDTSSWVYNATTFTYDAETITSKASTFYLYGTNKDAGNNKNNEIERSGAVGVGTATKPNHAVTKAQHDLKQDKDNQVEVSANSNVLNAWHGQTVLFAANCTITVPSTLNNSLGFVFRTLAGVTVTWAITAPFTWETTPSTTPEKTVGHFMRRGSTNTIILDF
ncbi:hypothetical protein [Flavobacterium gilvum]|uniref:Tail fiber protein n=1 Tax=Flavobacterium gilvum TaxID=1492737 RepID=A0AAC9I3R1_9FLAO|nr:hypothetical protein [Flavobacterium gilvum]AOW09530.1 hypothetical protein EM308_08460 [Flavobacterium gilvum]KFC60038.1 hypothetical protein FEM08_12170 [Flavobacterium gilvum]